MRKCLSVVAVAMACGLVIAASGQQPADYSSTPVFGGNGGGSFWSYCPMHTYLIGISGRTGDWIDAIQPICAAWSSQAQAFTAPVTGNMTGGSGGGPATLMCPAGMVIRGWEIARIAEGSARLVQYVRPQCESVLGEQRATAEIPGRFGGNGAIAAADRLGYKCPPGQYANGIYGASGSYVDNLGLECDAQPAILGRPVPAPAPEPVKSIGRVRGVPPGPPRSICESARDARARNSPAAPSLEAQCKAAGAAGERTPTIPAVQPSLTVAPAPARGRGGRGGAANGLVYALADNYDLLWFNHTGRDDGAATWATSNGKKVGTGWDVKQLFPGDNGVIYAVTASGDLLWYRHDGRGDGSFTWAASEGKKVGSGWAFKQVFSGGGGVIYGITASGDLLWYRHDGRADGRFAWAAPEGKKIGSGWDFTQVFAGGDGVIYAVTASGDLMWYRHDGRSDGTFKWAEPAGKKIGSGWSFARVFSSGDGIIYGVTSGGDLMWYRHDGWQDGTFRWAAPEGKKVGTGWTVRDVFSGANLRP